MPLTTRIILVGHVALMILIYINFIFFRIKAQSIFKFSTLEPYNVCNRGHAFYDY